MTQTHTAIAEDLTRLLTRADLSERLQISKRTISRMLSSGELPRPAKIGRLVRWRESDIAQFIERMIDQKPR
jgi:excisionase family DNA binding protein